MDGILRDIERLHIFASSPVEEFSADHDSFDIAKLHLREALEGVFHIGAHILSRMNGGRVTEYKEIARKLGEYGIVEKHFADTALIQMAGYRNRLTHFYAEISARELHQILQEHLDDFGIFLAAVKRIVENPTLVGLTIE